ncbi:hypothetical protein ScFU1_13030 [Streptococcus canis]|nr:hypothetical protein ScFU1_13030 [Streptococcus canis]
MGDGSIVDARTEVRKILVRVALLGFGTVATGLFLFRRGCLKTISSSGR